MNNMFSSVLEAPVAIPSTGLLHSDVTNLYERQEIPGNIRQRNFALSICGIKGVSFDADCLTSLYNDQMKSLDTWSLNEQLVTLQTCYTLLSDSSLMSEVLSAVPALYALLREAIKPLQLAFGEKKLLQIEALQSDEDTVLRVMVRLRGNIQKSAELMRKFKQDWWLEKADRSQASLVFDYEIGNGF